MRTIAVVARKGGSGKTTVAVSLAIAAHLRGLKAMLADADPQMSASEVMQGRRDHGPVCVQTTGPKLFTLQMSALRAEFDRMVIDTPAASESEFSHAMVLSDLSLLVVRPTYIDLMAAIRTLEVVRRLGRDCLIVLNQAPISREGAEPPAVRKALESLKLVPSTVAPIVLRARSAYQATSAFGLSVEELDPSNPAGVEIAALWDIVEGRLAARR